MKTLLNLLRSMRFAIAILTVVAVAATIGSVLEQSQPPAVYISHYGEFWAAFYTLCGLTDVYHAPWFFLLLAFMATSTALCLWQNTPSMIRDMRSYREQKSLASLRRLVHSATFPLPAADARLQQRLAGYLQAQGFRYKQADNAGPLLAARSGSLRRLGYLLVHGAMVLICVGGLIDGNVGLRLRLWSGALKLEKRELAPDQVPAISRLSADAGSYRATMNIPEGDSAATAQLQMGDGYLLQELPFSVRLKRFHIEHYANGQPKDFASDIDIVDGARRLPVTLQVNHPFTYRGVTLFQSGFADGGTEVKLHLLPLNGNGSSQAIAGKIGGGSALLLNGQPYTMEFTDLRATNVFANDDAPKERDWNSRGKPGERMHDVGPSLAFRLRDQQGQAEDWNLYQKPVAIDGARYFLIGRRTSQDDALRYVRLPADADDGLASYQRFAQAMAQPGQRQQAARALGAQASDVTLSAALTGSTARLLDAFAAQGFRAVARMVPTSASREQQMKIGQLYVQLMERAASQFDPQASPRRIHDSLAAYNDMLEANMPGIFQLDGYRQVNASGLQVTHAPGALLVYLGSALLAAGVIAMYFVRERRIWLHSGPRELLLAFAANRHSPALQAEFDGHRDAIARLVAATN